MMSADLDTIKWSFVDRAYSFIIIASAVCVLYDHLLTLQDEIELVWKRPRFSVVQVLFFINRYGGDALQIYPAFVIVRHIISHTTQEYVLMLKYIVKDYHDALFVFGIAVSSLLLISIFTKQTLCRSSGNLVQVYIGYLGSAVLFSVQGIMIFRVSSMYGHNRKVMALLAVAFTLEVTSMVISQSIANNIHSAVPDPAPGVHICKQDSFPTWAYSIWIPIVCFEVLLLVLAVAMGFTYYRSETRNLSILRASSGPPLLFILVRDSIIFPLIGLVICIANLVSWAGLPYLAAQISFVFALFVPCIMGSRLVLNLREAYYQPFGEECEIDFAHDSLSDFSVGLE